MVSYLLFGMEREFEFGNPGVTLLLLILGAEWTLLNRRKSGKKVSQILFKRFFIPFSAAAGKKCSILQKFFPILFPLQNE